MSSEADALVLRLELPLELAPTMNTYASKKRIRGKNGHRFVMAKLNKAVDEAIDGLLPLWPDAKLSDLQRWTEVVKDARGRPRLTKKTRRPRVRKRASGGRRRRVVVTRHSSVAPDEITVDVAGGKLPLDRLVVAGVLRDDNRKWCEREARWEYAPPKQGRVVIEVFEMEDE